MIGRAPELAALAELMCGAGGYRHALVIGEAGFGKSRLLEAAGDSARTAGIDVLVGACLPLSESLPLMPIADVMRAVEALDGGDVLDEALRQCRTFVREPIERLLSAAPLVPVSAADEPAAAAALRQQMFEAVRQLFAALAQHGGFAVVIEDLHWADAMTVDLLEYLLAPQHAAGVSVIASYRDHPAPVAGSPADVLVQQAIRRTDVLRVTLRPLSHTQVAEQIAALTGHRPEPDLADAVHRRSQGNPFFTEQLVAHMSDVGRIAEATEPFLPPGLADLLLSRVAGLDSSATELVAALAVAKRPLDAADLAALCGLPPAEADNALMVVQRRGLLLHDDRGYQLRHNLLAEAVEQDLVSSRRRGLHVAVGDLIAAWPEDRFAAEAAEHYERARETNKELDVRVRAGTYAQRAFAWAEAERHWRRALACYGPVVPRPGDRETAWDIYAGLYTALRAGGRVADATRFAEEAYERLLDHSEGLQRAELCRRLGALRGEASIEAGMPLLDSALSSCAGLPPSRVELSVLFEKEGMLRNAGHVAEARDVLDRMAAVAAALDASDAELEITGLRAWHLMFAGADDASLDLVEDLLAAGAETGGRRTPAYVGLAATAVLVRLGRLEQACAAGLRPLEVSEGRGLSNQFSAWLLRWDMADALIELGRTAEAAALLRPVASASLTRTTMLAFAASAHLMLLDGDVDAAALAWQSLDGIVISSLNFRTDYEQRRVELELWRDRPQAAFDRALAPLEAVIYNDASAFSGVLFVLAARAVADQCVTGRARRDKALVRDAQARAEQLLALHAAAHIDPLVHGAARPVGDALRATWDAELARAGDEDGAPAWHAAADAWAKHGRPHRAAYALLRQGEALLADRGERPGAREVLPRAAHLAHTHRPLFGLINDVAVRARIDLTAAAEDPRQEQLPRAKTRSVHRARACCTHADRRRPVQQRDRRAALHEPQDRERPRFEHPAQARGQHPRARRCRR